MNPKDWWSGRRVLLVEDEYLIANQMARRFTELGAIVVGPIATAVEAIGVASTENLDGAVIDINLRGDMAFDLADRLHELQVPFVFATGYDRSTIPPRFATVIHCEKPVDPSKVARALGSLL